MSRARIAAILGLLLAGTGAEAAQFSAPALSLNKGQVAQLNVTAADSESGAAAATCEAQLSFVDKDGAAYLGRDGQPIVLQVTLQPGETQSLQLSSALAVGNSPKQRSLFRARLVTQASVDSVLPDPCDGAVAAIEIIDEKTELSQFRLQMAMNREAKMLTVLSNIALRIEGAAQTLIENLK